MRSSARTVGLLQDQSLGVSVVVYRHGVRNVSAPESSRGREEGGVDDIRGEGQLVRPEGRAVGFVEGQVGRIHVGEKKKIEGCSRVVGFVDL